MYNELLNNIFFNERADRCPGMQIVNLEKGHTAVVAETIRQTVGGDLFAIETVRPYEEDHMKMIYQAKEELEQGIRPALKTIPATLEPYDVIFLCYPNWWSTLPMPVLAFLEQLDWNGKRILPVNTSEGGGAGQSVAKIREICTGAVIDPVYELIGSQVDSSLPAIEAWAKEAVAEKQKKEEKS